MGFWGEKYSGLGEFLEDRVENDKHFAKICLSFFTRGSYVGRSPHTLFFSSFPRFFNSPSVPKRIAVLHHIDFLCILGSERCCATIPKRISES